MDGDTFGGDFVADAGDFALGVAVMLALRCTVGGVCREERLGVLQGSMGVLRGEEGDMAAVEGDLRRETRAGVLRERVGDRVFEMPPLGGEAGRVFDGFS
jgi:hypothetical protein